MGKGIGRLSRLAIAGLTSYRDGGSGRPETPTSFMSSESTPPPVSPVTWQNTLLRTSSTGKSYKKGGSRVGGLIRVIGLVAAGYAFGKLPMADGIELCVRVVRQILSWWP